MGYFYISTAHCLLPYAYKLKGAKRRHFTQLGGNNILLERYEKRKEFPLLRPEKPKDVDRDFLGHLKTDKNYFGDVDKR